MENWVPTMQLRAPTFIVACLLVFYFVLEQVLCMPYVD